MITGKQLKAACMNLELDLMYEELAACDNDPSLAPSPEFMRKLADIWAEARAKRMKRLRIRKALLIAAVVALIAAMCAVVTVGVQKLVGFRLVEIDGRLQLVADGSDIVAIGKYEPSYLPEGYEETASMLRNNEYYAEYANGDGDLLKLTVRSIYDVNTAELADAKIIKDETDGGVYYYHQNLSTGGLTLTKVAGEVVFTAVSESGAVSFAQLADFADGLEADGG